MKKLLILALSMISVACSQKPQADIGLVLSTLNNPFFVELKDGAESQAKSLGVALITLDSQNDTAKELANIEDLISSGVKVILMNPVDSDSSARAAQLAIDAGISVISLDRNLNDVTVISHIASDNISGGKLAADVIAKVISPEDKIVELQGIPGTSAARERGQGFNEQIKQNGMAVAIQQTANFDRSQGLSVTENILQANPDTKAIFAHNDEMALGAERAVQDAGLNIVIVGFDATPDAVTAVSNGTLLATIAQQPKMIGLLGIDTAVSIIADEEVPPFIPVDLQVISLNP